MDNKLTFKNVDGDWEEIRKEETNKKIPDYSLSAITKKVSKVVVVLYFTIRLIDFVTGFPFMLIFESVEGVIHLAKVKKDAMEITDAFLYLKKAI